MGKGNNGGKKEKGQVKEHVMRTHGEDKGGLNVGGGMWVRQGRTMGGKVDNCN